MEVRVQAAAAQAQDRTELERTPIVGNRELPKVLYIVPWKKPPVAGLSLRPAGSVLDEPPAVIDREVLRRQLLQQARRMAPPEAGAAAPSLSTTPSPSSPGAPR